MVHFSLNIKACCSYVIFEKKWQCQIWANIFASPNIGTPRTRTPMFLILLPESAKHVLCFVSEGILDQISIALCFIILAPEFEGAFGKTNCRSLSERLMLLVKHSQSGNNWALQCLQSIHPGLCGKHTFALLRQQPYIQNIKSIPTYKINTLMYAFCFWQFVVQMQVATYI